MKKRECSTSGCPDPAVARIRVAVGASAGWLCGEHLVEEAEQVRDEPEFYGLPRLNLPAGGVA